MSPGEDINPVDATGRRRTDVEWYEVCRDATIDGRRVLNHALSPRFASIEKAREVLPAIRERFPDAFLGGGVRFFNRAEIDPAEAEERDEFFRSLVGWRDVSR